MKKLLILLLISANLTAFSQLRKIPASVTESFKDKYPSASNVEWKDKLSVFIAAFEFDGIQYEARFNSKGQWQETESVISESDLPAPVKDGFEKSKYADWEPVNFYYLQLPEDKTQYRIVVGKSDLQKKNLVFSSAGRLIKDKITL
ncbi:MAG: PepSY-like domain-containing protein [Gemmatimonadaceae bacterium]|nr:PepSY-like domain-containing protein [Chitinophagaceae bacterium]